MPFHTICIIEYNPETNPNDEHNNLKSTNYLINIKDNQKEFWYFINSAIGATFHRDLLDKKLKKEFKINKDDFIFEKFTESEFIGDNLPESIVCIIKLNESSFKTLNENKDVSYVWLNKDQLFSEIDNWLESQKWILEIAKETFKDEKLNFNDPTYLEKISFLRKAKELGNLAIFVGAGISKASGVPLWEELISELAKDILLKEKDFEIIPQLYYQEFGEVNYFNKIGNILNYENAEPNIIHKAIFKLDPIYVITTNYDNLLEIEAKNSGKNYFVVKKDKDLPYANSNKLIIKMHGDFNEKNIVLKEDDYLHYSNNFYLIENLLKSIFSSKTILFIGFSFSDRNLKKIIESVRFILKESYNPVYLFDPSNTNKHDLINIKYYQSRGVNVVQYEPSIEEYLRKIVKDAEATIPIKALGKSLSLKFKITNFLKFLKYYSDEDRIHLPNHGMSTIDKIYNGLVPYNDLPSIPYNKLIKIQPFAIGKKEEEFAKYKKIGWHLQTSSDEIIRLFNRIDKISNKIVFYKDGIQELNDSTNFKLYHIYKRLYNSGVFCIQRKHDFTEEIHLQIKLEESEKCNCPYCLFNDFKFEESLNSLTYYQINEDLMLIKLAFINFFYGDYWESYNLLKKSITISLSNSRFHLYFISIYNIRLIKYRIKYLEVPNQISSNIKQQIINEIDDLNLDSIIENLAINIKSKEILHDFVSQEIYYETYHEIKDIVLKIEDTYKTYQNENGEISAENYLQKLIWTYRIYYQNYSTNLLFDLYYIRHEEITTLLVRGILLSFVTNNRYKDKIRELELHDLKVIIKYTNPNKLFINVKELLIKNNKQLILSQKSIVDFFKLVDNYIDAHLSKTTIFNEEYYINKNVKFIRENRFIVDQRFRYIFDNMLILISQLTNQFEKTDDFSKIINKILIFIKEYTDKTFSDVKFMEIFISSLLKSETKIDYDLMLKACLSDYHWSEELVKTFVRTLKSQSDKKFVISNIEFYNEILKRVDNRQSYRLDLKSIIPLYSFFSEPIQVQFLDHILDNYPIEQVALKLKQQEISNNVIDKILVKKLIEFVKIEPEFEEDNGKLYLNTTNDFWCIFYLYIKGKLIIDLSDSKDIIELKNIYSMMLFPKDFDYKYFENKWFHIINEIPKQYWSHFKDKSIFIKEMLGNYLKITQKEELAILYTFLL